ncbi:helix-turn-helix transcriptional regulator [Mesorhizobium sp. B2-9-1]|uniref:helix-turn-helix domain-containing protein n=1 Tax=unclassified Mesorhizobium TaxID=325217 RepID=UPI00112A710A|nr:MULTISPECIES: helix-turn-helix transcriptional regulator [unclassified Mesorhizobium]TPI44061.1 helix-turn-helix transcriptional regulator [Mesorhizobium sp. B2-9-1]TPJ22765.1 helix-turn-helix transcriptional regulator [Mesorhizobium sp. B2-7-2]
MIAGRLRECLKILRWEAADVAEELGWPRNDVTRWLEGRAPVPLAVAAWIEALAKAHKVLPPPRLNRQNSAMHAPAGPVVVQAFNGIGQPRPRGVVLQPPYPRRHVLAGTTGLRPGAMSMHLNEGSDHEPRPL